MEVIDEHTTYRLLTSIGRTAAGPDGLTSWFLGTTATAITKPVAYLYGVSILSSYVPPQWKTSTITPVTKVTRPTKPADYRPISVTPILCRLLEKFIVRRFFHPFLLDPELNQEFADQYAFRPTGSTTAAISALLTDLMELLRENTFVHLIALDFTKAFDTVRHSSLAEQLAEMPMSDCVYNWFIAFL